MAKIMLVEDDNNLREIYEARLLAEGYEIVAAKDGEEALAMAVKEKPDLIISDVMMPKISGFDMLDILRSTPETKNTKVIMMTALSQAEDKARAEKLGADRYLVKSQVTLEDVAKTAHDVLEGGPGAIADQGVDPTALPAAPAGEQPSAPAPAPQLVTPTPAPEPSAVPPAPAFATPNPVAAPAIPAPVPQADNTPAPAAPIVTAEPAAPAAMPAPTPEPAVPAFVSSPSAAPASFGTPAAPAFNLPPALQDTPQETQEPTAQAPAQPFTPATPAPTPIAIDTPAPVPDTTMPLPEPVAQNNALPPAQELPATPALDTDTPAIPADAPAQGAGVDDGLTQTTEAEEAAIDQQIEDFIETIVPNPDAPEAAAPGQVDPAAPAAPSAPAPTPEAPAEDTGYGLPGSTQQTVEHIDVVAPPDESAPAAPSANTPEPAAPTGPAPEPAASPAAPADNPGAINGKKIIAPINDPRKQPDLNQLLAQEEARDTAKEILENQAPDVRPAAFVGTPAGEQPAQQFAATPAPATPPAPAAPSAIPSQPTPATPAAAPQSQPPIDPNSVAL